MSDELDIHTSTILSNSEEKNKSLAMPPEAEHRTINDDVDKDVQGQSSSDEVYHPTTANGSSETNRDDEDHQQQQDVVVSSTKLKEDDVTRGTVPDGTAIGHDETGTSFDGDSRMNGKNNNCQNIIDDSPREILISHKNSNEEEEEDDDNDDNDDDNNSVDHILRDIQSVSTATTCKTKEPEGRISRVASTTDLSTMLDDDSNDEQEPQLLPSKEDHPCEPSPVMKPLETINPYNSEGRKPPVIDPISPVTSLESAAVDAVTLKQQQDVLVPLNNSADMPEETAQLLLQLQNGASPPPLSSSNLHIHSQNLSGNSDLSAISEQRNLATTAMQPVMEVTESEAQMRRQISQLSGSDPPEHSLPTFPQQIDANSQRNSLAMPSLPQLLPAQRVSQTSTSNGYHHHLSNPQAAAAGINFLQMHHPSPLPSSVIMPMSHSGGKRKIHLRLVEDMTSHSTPNNNIRKTPSFLSFRRRKAHQRSISENEVQTDTDRGRVTVSWYEGTTSLELQEHVRNTVIRKLGLNGTTRLVDMRILDESSNPPEEIVLSTYIPNGSRLLLRFSTKDAAGDETPPRRLSYTGGAPDSPSAAPSPHASSLDLHGLGLNRNQLALLGARLEASKMPPIEKSGAFAPALSSSDKSTKVASESKSTNDTGGSKSNKSTKGSPSKAGVKKASADRGAVKKEKDNTDGDSGDDEDSRASSTMEMHSLHPEDQIQKSLRQITELLVAERTARKPVVPRQEKRQVVFVLANYFVLFLSLIAISAEIQARAPGWNASVEQYLKNVQTCSQDQDALFECVSKGDFAGLLASVVLWFSRSAATKRIFLFGFESPKKLWTVVYESLVTAICWGFSYMFIRRGMNPDTSRNFLQKYWKDAIYGSLAGFNAAFLKHVLKNLIPQEAIEDALQDRQLKILSWLPSFS